MRRATEGTPVGSSRPTPASQSAPKQPFNAFAMSCMRRLARDSPLEEEENQIAPSAFQNGADVDPLNACQAAREPEVRHCDEPGGSAMGRSGRTRQDVGVRSGR